MPRGIPLSSAREVMSREPEPTPTIARVFNVIWFHIEPIDDELALRFLRWQGEHQIYPVGLGGRIGGGRVSQGFIAGPDAKRVERWLLEHGVPFEPPVP